MSNYLLSVVDKIKWDLENIDSYYGGRCGSMGKNFGIWSRRSRVQIPCSVKYFSQNYTGSGRHLLERNDKLPSVIFA